MPNDEVWVLSEEEKALLAMTEAELAEELESFNVNKKISSYYRHKNLDDPAVALLIVAERENRRLFLKTTLTILLRPSFNWFDFNKERLFLILKIFILHIQKNHSYPLPPDIVELLDSYLKKMDLEVELKLSKELNIFPKDLISGFVCTKISPYNQRRPDRSTHLEEMIKKGDEFELNKALDRTDSLENLEIPPVFLEQRNIEGLTPLCLAIRLGHRNIAECLVEAGANCENYYLHEQGRLCSGDSLLSEALQYMPEIVPKLIKKGCILDKEQHDYFVMMYRFLEALSKKEQKSLSDSLIALKCILENLPSHYFNNVVHLPASISLKIPKKYEEDGIFISFIKAFHRYDFENEPGASKLVLEIMSEFRRFSPNFDRMLERLKSKGIEYGSVDELFTEAFFMEVAIAPPIGIPRIPRYRKPPVHSKGRHFKCVIS